MVAPEHKVVHIEPIRILDGSVWRYAVTFADGIKGTVTPDGRSLTIECWAPCGTKIGTETLHEDGSVSRLPICYD